MFYIVGYYRFNSDKFNFGYLASDNRSGGYPCFADLNTCEARIIKFETIEDAIKEWEKSKKYLNLARIQDVEVVQMVLETKQKLS